MNEARSSAPVETRSTFTQQRNVDFGDEPKTPGSFFPVGADMIGRLTDDWQCARSQTRTLLLHPHQGPPGAVIFLNQFDPGTSPARDHARFQKTVLPQLSSSAWRPLAKSSDELSRLTTELAENSKLSRQEAAQQLEALLTPTLGQGMGFAMRSGSFSGWKWIGRNAHQVEIRLGRSTGIWGSLQIKQDLQQVLDYLEFYDPGAIDLIRATLDNSSAAPLPPRTAYLVLGSAQRNLHGLHLAILCTLDCPVKDQLSDFLTTLRPKGENILPRDCSSDTHDLLRLADRAQIPLLTEKQQFDLEDLSELAPPVYLPTAPQAEPPISAPSPTE